MNWMLILVVIIFLIALIWGWSRGFLRMLFSLVSLIVLIWLIQWVTPYISTFLKNYTGLYDRIENWVGQKMTDTLGSGLSFFTDAAAGTAADWILKGVAFLIAVIVALIIVLIIFKVIGLIDRVPIVRGVNRWFGLVAGAVEGYLVICLLFLLVGLIAGSNIGQTLTQNIESNSFLLFLNDHNILMNLNLFKTL